MRLRALALLCDAAVPRPEPAGVAVPLRGGGYARLCVDGPVLDGDAMEHVGEHFGSAS